MRCGCPAVCTLSFCRFCLYFVDKYFAIFCRILLLEFCVKLPGIMSSNMKKKDDEQASGQRQQSNIRCGRRSLPASNEERDHIEAIISECEDLKEVLETESKSWQELHDETKESVEEAKKATLPLTQEECRIGFYHENLLNSRPDYDAFLQRLAKCDSVSTSYISYLAEGEKMLDQCRGICNEIIKKKKRDAALSIVKTRRPMHEIMADLAKIVNDDPKDGEGESPCSD